MHLADTNSGLMTSYIILEPSVQRVHDEVARSDPLLGICYYWFKQKTEVSDKANSSQLLCYDSKYFLPHSSGCVTHFVPLRDTNHSVKQ